MRASVQIADYSARAWRAFCRKSVAARHEEWIPRVRSSQHALTTMHWRGEGGQGLGGGGRPSFLGSGGRGGGGGGAAAERQTALVHYDNYSFLYFKMFLLEVINSNAINAVY